MTSKKSHVTAHAKNITATVAFAVLLNLLYRMKRVCGFTHLYGDELAEQVEIENRYCSKKESIRESAHYTCRGWKTGLIADYCKHNDTIIEAVAYIKIFRCYQMPNRQAGRIDQVCPPSPINNSGDERSQGLFTL